jgi:ribose transport system ATP-binding protein
MVGDAAALLDARDIRKAYGGAVALRSASLAVARGEIHALLGENGAGKSTLIKCIAGTPPPDSGTIVVDGRELPPRHGPLAASEAGLAFIHQESTLIEDLSVEENIAFVEGYPRRLGLIDWAAVRRRSEEALAALNLPVDPRARVAELPIASRTTVAIARALALSAKLVVLDEPTASLGAKDVAALFAALRRMAARGEAVIFVSHRLDEVFDLCDRVTVLRDGANVGSARPGDISRHDLVTMICGREVNVARKPAAEARAKPLIEAKALEGEVVAPVDFSVAPGEIVGFTGLSDAGHYDLGEMLFGLAPVVGGEAMLDGKPFRPRSPGDAMAAGVGYVPRDRNGEGLARDMTLTENLFFNPDSHSPGMAGSLWVSGQRQEAAARSLLARFAVRPPIPDAFVATLSGGNAQKVLLARWLSTKARLLIINDVSVGVDVGAREDIYTAIRQAAADAAVMIVTSDFEEIENLCSRAFVFVRGVLRATLTGDEVTVARMSGALVRAPSPDRNASRTGPAA